MGFPDKHSKRDHCRPSQPAPNLGQQTTRSLQTARLSDSDIADLAKHDVIGNPPGGATA